jgi:hypothetical protein
VKCVTTEVKGINVALTKVEGTAALAVTAANHANHANQSIAHLQLLSQPQTEMMNMLQELKKKVEKLEEEKSLLSQVARQALTRWRWMGSRLGCREWVE